MKKLNIIPYYGIKKIYISNISMINFTNKIQQKRIENQKILQYKKLEQQKRENLKMLFEKYIKFNKPFELKKTYDSKIPLNIYTCWHTKDLPPLMKQNYERLKNDNPEFNHFLYDEDECRDFIKNNFDKDVLHAYNSLIPCSYKSDLWRFCVLYINGGIYLDIKYKCANGFKFVALTENEYFVRDIPEHCVYTALIITMPKNDILLKCIKKIVLNVKNKYYGPTSLYPTGPGLLGLFFKNNEIQNLEHFLSVINIEGHDRLYIIYKNTLILECYHEYRKEQAIYQKNKYYTDLWNQKKIYY